MVKSMIQRYQHVNVDLRSEYGDGVEGHATEAD